MLLHVEKAATMPVAEKIKLIRKSKNLKQIDVADAIWTSPTKISMVENGEGEYSPEQIKRFKLLVGFPDMPLTDFECAAFKNRLYYWRGLVIEGRMEEAKELYGKISQITDLDVCDNDLPILFRLFEAIYLGAEENLDAVREKVEFLKGYVDKMNAEHLFFFHNIVGWLNLSTGDYKEALTSYKKAHELLGVYDEYAPEDEEKLFHNIAQCYQELEIPHQAIKFLSEICKRRPKSRISKSAFRQDITLATAYRYIGKINEAEKILETCLEQAEGFYDEFYVGVALYNLGLLYKHSRDWEKAISYLDQALEAFETGSSYHLWINYHRIYCVVESRKFADAIRAIEKAEKLYPESEESMIIFGTLLHFHNLKRRMSTFVEETNEYIETKTIPFFIKDNNKFEALNYCAALERHYLTVRSNNNALLMAKTMRDLHSEIYIGLDEGGEKL